MFSLGNGSLDAPNPSLLNIQNTIQVEETKLEGLRAHDFIKESGRKGNSLKIGFQFVKNRFSSQLVEEKKDKEARNFSYNFFV